MEKLITVDELGLENAVKQLNSALKMAATYDRNNLTLSKEILRIPSKKQERKLINMLLEAGYKCHWSTGRLYLKW